METDKYRHRLTTYVDIDFNKDVILCENIPNNIKNIRGISLKSLTNDNSNLNSKKKNELELKWIEFLTQQNELEFLHVIPNISQGFFDAICRLNNLKYLSFKQAINIKNIDEIQNLQNLQRLDLSSFTKIEDISPLINLSKLEKLIITNCFKVKNYEEVGNVKNLIALNIEGEFSSPKNLQLKSLVPYTKLRNLEQLDLSLTTINEKDYLKILEIPSLIRLDASWVMKESLREEIKSQHPNLKEGFFVKYDFKNKRFYENVIWK